jgi:hypothetical protein
VLTFSATGLLATLGISSSGLISGTRSVPAAGVVVVAHRTNAATEAADGQALAWTTVGIITSWVANCSPYSPLRSRHHGPPASSAACSTTPPA